MSAEIWKVIGLAFVVVAVVAAMSMLYGFVFWLIWTAAGIGERLFTFLPSPWHRLGFWDCCLLVWLLSIMGQSLSSTVTAKAKARE